jgi:hypothetical protein
MGWGTSPYPRESQLRQDIRFCAEVQEVLRLLPYTASYHNGLKPGTRCCCQAVQAMARLQRPPAPACMHPVGTVHALWPDPQQMCLHNFRKLWISRQPNCAQ